MLHPLAHQASILTCIPLQTQAAIANTSNNPEAIQYQPSSSLPYIHMNRRLITACEPPASHTSGQYPKPQLESGQELIYIYTPESQLVGSPSVNSTRADALPYILCIFAVLHTPRNCY
ncbi:hypothetical protein B0O99DRAFT_616611 [Bisporella sp. PMI_857]|nr:hypothetical protein B0O99DRAFT_616611 [Bisporella sp. PMI_857]